MAVNPEGVYFRREDCASVWLRLLIEVIDALVITIICVPLAIALLWIFQLDRIAVDLAFGVVALVLFLYLVILKRSRFGTIGYRAGRVRIVGLDGQVAGIFALTLRMLFILLGPLNWLIDLAWISNDPHRQSLRDKFAHTYVINAKAQPLGTGRVVYRYYDILGYYLLFPEVVVPEHRVNPECAGKTA